MKSFEYAAPKNVKDAVALLGDKWGETEILAGGTDLLTSMKQGIVGPKRLVSLKNIPELRGIKTDGDNLRIGARYLKNQRDHFDAAPVLCIPAYNAGPGAPDQWLKDRPGVDFDLWVEHIPYTETREYTKRVITSWFAYEILYGKGIPELPTRPL